MTRCHWMPILLICACLQTGCQRGPDSPEQVANKFLNEVSRENCAKAWKYFSGPSQEKIRAESAQATKRDPSYADDYTPENLYCKSRYANRFRSVVPGSAKLQNVKGTHALVLASRRQSGGANPVEPAGGNSVPGPVTTKLNNMPLEIRLVQENGNWKIDIVQPAARESGLLAARRRATDRELERIRAPQMTNRPSATR
ncbi:MAG TPA: hypothetical protein VK615_11165 [Candidatus Binatia bacterium]|nr:hypothetical protein [Candidatus Binatia bacterium]